MATGAERRQAARNAAKSPVERLARRQDGPLHLGVGTQEAAIAEAPGSAAPQRQPRRAGRLGGWWSGWLARHVPVMDDPAPGRLDRLDGVTDRPHGTGPTLPVAQPDAAPDRPARGAES